MDLDYDENRGNPARPECLVSCNVNEDFYKATQDAWAWEDPADGDPQFKTLPIVRLEAMFRRCRLARRVVPPFGGFMEACLHLHDFLVPALEFLIEEGLLVDEEGDEVQFAVQEDLYDAAQTIVEANLEEEALTVDQDCFDSLDALVGQVDLAWLNLDISNLCKTEGTIEAYVTLSLMLYARDGNAHRGGAANNPLLVGSSRNGLLAGSVADYYMPSRTVIPATAFLVSKLESFLIATRWPPAFHAEHDSLDNYGYDLSGKARMLVAKRAEWNAMLLPFMGRAVSKLATIAKLMQTRGTNTPAMVRDLERLAA